LGHSETDHLSQESHWVTPGITGGVSRPVDEFVGFIIEDIYDHKLRAKKMAFFRSSILSTESFVIKEPILFFETV
jgi:hypothetical protein